MAEFREIGHELLIEFHAHAKGGKRDVASRFSGCNLRELVACGNAGIGKAIREQENPV